MRKGLFAAAAALFVGAGLWAGSQIVYAQGMAVDTIADGVFIDDIDMSGMTISEAVAAVDEYITATSQCTIRLNIDSNWVEVKASDLGLSCANDEVVEEAFEYGKNGNYVQKYKIMKDLQNEPHVFDLIFEVKEDKVRSVVEEKCTVYNMEATDASIRKEGDGFEIIPGKAGIKLDVEASVDAIMDYIGGEWECRSGAVDLVCEVDQPQGTEEDFEKVKDVLGTFTTSFSSSGANRTKNVTTGVEKINGTLLFPGEALSVYELTNPFTEENGYATATAYENGMEVDSVGGGICQVSTTLYNAALKAELEIVERYNHSMIVGYVDPSMDAAIAGTFKDLKIKNNTDAPVYIEGKVADKKATFTIYGQETRAENRKVTYKSEVLEVTNPEPALVYIADKTQPIGYMKRTQGVHTGYKAQLWKIVTVDGVEESREVINKSTYKAVPAYCSVGTFWADPAASAAVEAAIATQDEGTIRSTITPYAEALAAASGQ